MNKKDGIKMVHKITIDRKKGNLVVYKNVYIKIKPGAIDTSDWEDFRIIHYFPIREIRKFEIEV